MKKKVRITAAITPNKWGGYRVVQTDGAYSDHPTLESAQSHANWINNEDSDWPRYMEVEVDDTPSIAEENEVIPYYERIAKERKVREEKKRAEAEKNRKSKKADDKYVFVVSCILRGSNYVVYLQGETNITKIGEKFGGGFITTKVKDAKVFNTKASAQKFIDSVEKCWMVNALFRSMKVVRKAKKDIV